MMKKATFILMLLTMLAAGVQTASAQTVSDGSAIGTWYAGLGGGTSFGQATFRSITESKTNVGAQFGVFGGYQLSRLFSVEALATMGWQKQTSLDCDPYWLSIDGVRTFAPVLGKQGNYYRDLEAKTQWMRFGLQANFDVLSLLTKPTTRWSVTLSPQVSAVTTRTKHLATGYDNEFDRQWHLGLGGQAAVGYRVAKNIGLQLYGGITCLTGSRFDNIPEHCHKSNLIYEGGLKLSYHFGKKKPTPIPSREEGSQEVTPVVEQQPVVEESVVEEKPAPVVEKAQPVVETAAVAATAVSNSVADITLPVIYFANNSSRLSDNEAAKLDNVVRLMQEQPDVTLSIVGHASDIGSTQYNRKLSQRRANRVKRCLVAKGIAAARLHPVVGKGIDHEAEDHPKARRVELIINEK